MATKIILKKSSTGGGVPLAADLDNGELAVNLVDRKIYTKDNGGTIVKLDGAYVDSSAPGNPAEGDLWYDTTNNLLKAHNGSSFVSAGYATLAALEDITITSAANGEILRYDGSGWINNTLAEAGIQAEADTTADARAAISLTDNGGDGSASYNSTTGEIQYTGPSAAETRAHFSGATGIAISSGQVSIDFTEFDTGDIVEGSKLFHTEERVQDVTGAQLVTNGSHTNITASYDDAGDGAIDLAVSDATIRGKVSVTDTGGDGSLSYNNGTGVFTYTGPNATEVRAHFTGGTGVSIVNGTVAIGQAVATSDDVEFNTVTTDTLKVSTGTITLDPTADGANTGTVVVAGNLTVNGTTTAVNSNEVNIGDSIIVLNSDEAGTPSQDGGIEIERGTSPNKSFIWNEGADAWDLSDETLQGVVIDGGTY